jgi:hypothetical protein
MEGVELFKTGKVHMVVAHFSIDANQLMPDRKHKGRAVITPDG